ncbi:MAG: sugar phosphate isomerase/epimerase [Lentisphaeria bacterium]|nr:sugar phosphate isomerase/epimerase [Lentisphaeria bacterium]
MKKTKSVMEIGVLARLHMDGNPFDIIAEHGVSTAQLCNWNMDLWTPENSKKIKKAARQSKVRINCVWAGYSGPAVWNLVEGPYTLGLVPPEFRAQRVLDLKKGVDFAVECGAPAIATHCGFIPEVPGDPLYQGTIDAIGEVAEYCRKAGLEFWFETGQETPVTLLRAIEDINLDNLGINFDTANVILYGKGNPLDALDVFGKYVRCIHAKDGLYPVNGRELGKEVPVGTGKSQYTKLIPKLYDLGFTGDLIIEREISGEQQARDIARTLKYLRKLVGKTLEKHSK